MLVVSDQNENCISVSVAVCSLVVLILADKYNTNMFI